MLSVTDNLKQPCLSNIYGAIKESKYHTGPDFGLSYSKLEKYKNTNILTDEVPEMTSNVTEVECVVIKDYQHCGYMIGHISLPINGL